MYHNRRSECVTLAVTLEVNGFNLALLVVESFLLRLLECLGLPCLLGLFPTLILIVVLLVAKLAPHIDLEMWRTRRSTFALALAFDMGTFGALKTLATMRGTTFAMGTFAFALSFATRLGSLGLRLWR